ncbi:uncharacterized protein TM35_000012230 [Trypanosoma theileri]|uniref:Uncharacterized protein n=1 Tax=Trypanosoma theileri TaxID=67003 RepID=A0A1X0P8U1_9TRYP|nr:uncharacterized protein TM35_000012230 [Trypanosoma theileri]ORC93346.1 hypothetical protein TM35_000012230 [Trypanosoma theileri]
MKLVKFINCDAPRVPADAFEVLVEEERIRVAPNSRAGNVGSRKNGNSAEMVHSWRVVSSAPSTTGCYWLLNDDNTPIGPIDEVMLAVRDDTHKNNNNNNINNNKRTPAGVEESHVEGVDLRSKMGRQLQRTREEYGQTFKTAAKNAALLMDAERLKTGREEKTKLERKRVVEAIENGEEPARKTRVKTEGSSSKRG